jgi:hypothetical protein
VAGTQQRFNGSDLTTALRDAAFEFRRGVLYCDFAGFGAHLCPVFTTHPIRWPIFFTP